MWPALFEELVRVQIKLAPDTALGADDALDELGLDSLGTVSLLMEIEQAYGVVFPDDSLVPATFATPGSLWSVLAGLAVDQDRIGSTGV